VITGGSVGIGLVVAHALDSERVDIIIKTLLPFYRGEMKSYLLAHYLGTSGNKATLFSSAGDLLLSVTEP
jgi:hypothetical protein